jgi:hypothetical protein
MLFFAVLVCHLDLHVYCGTIRQVSLKAFTISGHKSCLCWILKKTQHYIDTFCILYLRFWSYKPYAHDPDPEFDITMFACTRLWTT